MYRLPKSIPIQLKVPVEHNPTGTLYYMKNSRHVLKRLREESPLDQKDVAHLVGIKASNLVRYEHGHRNPPPELLLIYHILFDTSLQDMFAPIHKHIADTLRARSKQLIADVKNQQLPKSGFKLHFLKELVNKLNSIVPYEQGK
jgi:transcriptional regulator with XRE-family HTH domain